MPTDIVKYADMDKDLKSRTNKRKIAYVYLMHRMFGGSPVQMQQIMKMPNVTIAELQDWDIDYKEAVYAVIAEEDAKGVEMRDPNSDVPSIRSIKEKILRQTEKVINETTDPARLASAYKVLSEFEVVDEKKDKGVLDAINEAVKPLTAGQKAKRKTMLDKMRENGAVVDLNRARADGAYGENEENVEE